jgi:hypothetical protein
MKKKTKYLPLADVTNLYSQFGQLSPKDKAIANKQSLLRSEQKRAKKYIIVGDDNYWYATTGKVTKKELVKIVNDTIEMIKKGDQFIPSPASDPTELYAYPVNERITFPVD